MAKIKLTLPLGEIPVDGKQVTFVAPCDCSAADGIQIDGVDYDIVDSIGRTVSFRRGVWDVGAVLTVTLDVTNHKAYLQNQNSYTKAETLTNATASLYGLGTDAVPDDVFSVFHKYYWSRRHLSLDISLGDVSEVNVYSSYQDANKIHTINYSTELEIDETGKAALKNPTTIQTSYANVSQLNAIKGKYWESTASTYPGIYFTPEDASNVRSLKDGDFYWGYIYASAVTCTTTYGDPQIVFSSKSDTYPSSGVLDNYEYRYLGVPFDNALTASKIATGSYKGTGTYGENNPCSLTFDFEPKLLMIYGNGGGYDTGIMILFRDISRLTKSITTNFDKFYFDSITWGSNSVSWWSSQNDYYQANAASTYKYIAIG